MILSIIIPVYNGAATIGRCLDSIYSQGMVETDFEVICVDDCSPDPSSVAAIENYKFNEYTPNNLILIKHKENRRQGGARNTGIRLAKGKWILFIDQDDFFVKDAIKSILSFAQRNTQLWFIMFDFFSGDGFEVIKKGRYAGLNENVMTGVDFLQKLPVPWSPWCYIYNREYLLDSKILFAENVRFEDADFVLKYTAKSRMACFVPIIVVYYVLHSTQTTMVGNDKNRIGDYVRMSCRIAFAADEEQKHSIKAGKAIMKHAIFMRRTALLQYLWRLPYKDINSLLCDNKFPFVTGCSLIDITNRNTKTTAFILTILKPLFHIAAFLKHLTKRII